MSKSKFLVSTKKPNSTEWTASSVWGSMDEAEEEMYRLRGGKDVFKQPLRLSVRIEEFPAESLELYNRILQSPRYSGNPKGSR